MSTTSQPPRWLFWWSIVTALAAVPLLFLGAEVTTRGVGMVDPVGLRSPWYFFQEFLRDRGLAWLVEHGHRQVGWLVGNCVIVLTILTWWKDPRRGVRLFSLAILLAVCIQGALGIFRIELHAVLGNTLALIHGALAPIVFAMLVAMAVLMSPGWRVAAGSPLNGDRCSRRLRRWSLHTMALVYGQMILGGVVRHLDVSLGARLHLFGAFIVFGAVLWLARLAYEDEHAGWGWKLILSLVFLQIMLGVEAWMGKFFVASAPWNQLQPLHVHPEILRSLHYVIGVFVLATSAAFALRLHRNAQWLLALKAPERRMEGAV